MTIKALAGDTQYKWVVLAVATLAQACACFFVQGFGSIALNIKQAMLLSDWQIGLLVSAAQLVPLAGLLVAGELLDRYSERFVVGIGTLIVGASLCGASIASDYSILLMLFVILGLGYSTAQPGGSKSVSGWFANKHLGFAMGIRQAGLPLGGAVATLLLPYIAQRFSLQSAFFYSGLIAIAGGLFFMLLYRPPPLKSAQAKKSVNLKAAVVARLSMAKEPSMINIMMSGVCLTASQYGISVFLVLYLYTSLELTSSLATTMFFIVLGFGVIGRIVLAAWSDQCRHGRFFPVLTCLCGAAIALLLLPILHTSNSLILALYMAFTGFFTYGWYGPWVAYIADSAPADRKGFALGMAMTANQIGVVLVPPTIGLAKDALGTYSYGWYGLALLSLWVFYNTQKRAKMGAVTADR
ncbi:MFS transporter [Pseudomonas abieticivorans]|uniref:MFS transporter n=1 Tax=Pseudomonas abieticivorans TaxID=2931382 RepID=UPI0020BE22FF|nr:MFS transporter [Pseudomonas sp. PIA16]